MRILILGGYGLIGSYVLARLHTEGHELVGAGRDIATAKRRFPFATWVEADLRRLTAPADWNAYLLGVDAVVNCAGALQDSPRDDLRAAHVLGPLALYEACVANGIRRVVHVSAADVGPDRPTAFNASKLEAETELAKLDLDWTILRPGLVLAPAAYGGTALLRGLAAFPGAIPSVYSDSIVRVVSVEDVAEAVARCLGPAAVKRRSLDLVSEQPTQLADVLQQLRAWLGLKPAPLLRLPPAVVRAGALASDAIAFLGWRSPMRTTSVEQLRMGVLGRGEDCEQVLGFRPKRLDEMLAGWPSGVQERWFAKLYFLKPLILLTLIAFWLTSGLIALTISFTPASALLAASGVPVRWAGALTVVTALLDIGLGALACFRRFTPMALKGMLIVSGAYLVGACGLRPSLWLDPLGPLVKVLPGMALALVSLAVIDER